MQIYLNASVAQQRCARCHLTSRGGGSKIEFENPFVVFFFFFTKTVSSLPLQAAEIEELSYVKKHCPRVVFIWFELYFREISYEKHCRLRVNFSISVRRSIYIINSVDKPNFYAKTLSASRLKTIMRLERLNNLPLNTVTPKFVAIFVSRYSLLDHWKNFLFGNRSEMGSHFVSLRLLGGE